MMRLYRGDAVARIDRRTIADTSIPGVVLMEQAGRAVAETVRRRWPGRRVCVLAGKGNNGGDGYVAARWLRHFGADVRVFALADPAELSGDVRWAAASWQAVGGQTNVLDPPNRSIIGRLARDAVLVDAVFGTGLTGSMREPFAEIFAALAEFASRHALPVVAVDVPSGIDAGTGALTGPVLQADCTVTMGLHKIGLWSWPGAGRSGTIECVDLGYPESIVAQEQAAAWGLELNDLPVARRPAAGHKGTFGDVALCAGSPAMPGAAMLCARAALRAGAGRVMVCSDQRVLTEMPPEVIRVPQAGSEPGPWSFVPAQVASADAVVVGPGWGRFEGDRAWLETILSSRRGQPTVIDADGLRVLADGSAQHLGADVVLTPHPGEAAALLGCTVPDIQQNRMAAAQRLVERWGATIVLKGAGTIIASPDRPPHVLRVANPALAIPGSGDVLAGIVATCTARCREHFEAVCEAVIWHAAAARLLPPAGNCAGDIADLLPTVRDWSVVP